MIGDGADDDETPPDPDATPADTGEAPSRGPDVAPAFYELGAEVAEGGIGRVIAARDRRLDRPVAIKRLRFRGAAFEARFRREVKITARLQHPSIVPIYEAGAWPSGEPFYVMRLISGRSLKEVLAGARDLDERVALLPSLLAAVEAVAYAHSERVIHRDLKPANIMLGPFGETLVIDWGLAKLLDGAEPDGAPDAPPAAAADAELTQAGAVVGTPAYMPPEQASGAPVDERADVYALGAILYHLLVGQAPYGGRDSGEVLAAVRASAPPTVATRNPSAPAELAAIADKATARQPRDRYPSARELAEDLRRYQTGKLVGALRYSPATLLRRWVRRNRPLVAVGAASLLAVAAIAAVSVVRVVRERDHARAAQAVAEEARAESEARRHQLLLAQARLLVEKKPTEAFAYLKSYAAAERPDWSAVWSVAADAQSRVVARRVYANLKLAGLSPDGARLAAVDGEQLVLVDVERGTRTILRSGGPAVRHLRLAAAALFVHTADGKLTRWDLATNRARELAALKDDVAFLTGTPDGARFAAATVAGPIHVYDRDGRAVVLRGHAAPARFAQFSPDGRSLVSVGDDGATRLWSIDGDGDGDGDGAASRVLLANDMAWSSAFSPDGRRLAVCGLDGTVHLFDLARGTAKKLSGHRDRVGYAAFSPDGRTLYSSSTDWSIRAWDAESGAPRDELKGHRGIVEKLALSPDGRFLASASGDQTIRVWDLLLHEARELRGHDDYISLIAFTQDSARLVTADPLGRVRVWDVPAPPSIVKTRGEIRDLVVTRDDTIWAVSPGELIAFGADGRERARHEHPDIRPPLAAALDGSATACAGKDGAVQLWRRDATTPQILPAHHAAVNVMVFSPDARTLATAGDDRAIQLWSVETGALVATLEGHSSALWVLEFSPDGKQLVSAGDEPSLRLWDLSARRARVLPAADLVYRADFSADGQWLAWTGGDATARVLPLAGGEVRTLSGHLATVREVALSPDGKYLATGSDDRTARLWTLADGQSEVLPHEGSVRLVRFSRDGHVLLTSSEDGSLRLWEPSRRAALGVLRSDRSCDMAALTNNGRFVIAGYQDDHFVRVWEVGVPSPQPTANWLEQISSVMLGPGNELISK